MCLLCECVDCASLVALGTVLTDGVKSGELREALQVISVVIAVSLCVCRAAQRGLCNRSGVSLAGSKQGGGEGGT